MRCPSHQHSRFKQILTHSFCLLIALFSTNIGTEQQARAACLLSYDNAQVLTQGDALARLSFQGGQEGFGSHIEGRIGLPGERSLYLRSGLCQRTSLWAWAIESGINQQFLSVKELAQIKSITVALKAQTKAQKKLNKANLETTPSKENHESK